MENLSYLVIKFNIGINFAFNNKMITYKCLDKIAK